MTFTPTYVCVGSIFIDDIVFPDGRTKMEVLGGAGTHAAAGVAVWGERPGLVANAGVGMPQSVMTHMERDFDLQGIQQVDVPQGRAWQIFEWDNRRIEIFRTPSMEPFAFFPDPDRIPVEYHHPQAATILRGAVGFRVSGARLQRRDRAVVLTFALYGCCQPRRVPHGDERCHIISPNLVESQAILGIEAPEAILRDMPVCGAQIVALRMGERGSLIGQGIDHLI
ncbi:MAG: hypothetical protein U0670_01200 [Anaerolineae bacterium]